MADPDTSQAVLHFSGGSFSSQRFLDCVPPGVREVDGPSDFHFYYPDGRRTWTFKSNPDGSKATGADAPAIRVSTSNQIELYVSGTATFSLNTACAPWTDTDGRKWEGGPFQRFHDTIGRHNLAFTEDVGGQPQPDGWRIVAEIFVGGPIERAMDRAGQPYEWQALYSSAKDQTAWAEVAERAIPELIEEQAGGPHFILHNVQFDKPNVPASMMLELEEKAASIQRQQTANADRDYATSFPGGLLGYSAYLRQLAETKALNEGRGLLIPQGSSVIVPQSER
ncbi:MAG: hypothetical protein ACT4NY_09190 [Pseudonocardiales bacterium]